MKPLTVAITGINATHNPGPGVAVARSLRAHPAFDGRIIGLAYDSLDPGIYAADIVDDVFLIPYPSQGSAALEERLRYIAERSHIDVVLPTLDSELASFIALQPLLEDLGIGHFLPTHEQLELRSKQHLAELGARADMPVPATRVINAADELFSGEPIDYPVYVKGVFYGAKRAHNVHEASAAFHTIVARWGLPVLIQAETRGVEIDVVGLGDGHGGLVGAVPMKKLVLTDEGKGWAGVAIRDPEALAMTRRFTETTGWRGPFELEVMKDEDSGDMQVMEINPRFPAWCYLSAGAGANLPYACAQLAAGRSIDPADYVAYEAGTMFVRIALDQIVSLDAFQRVASAGELMREDRQE